MSEVHFSASDAALYLRRELDSERSSRIETHAAQCIECAVRLQEEAVLELQLTEVAAAARQVGTAGVARVWPRWAIALTGTLALAASLLLFFIFRAQTPAPIALPENASMRRVDHVLDCLSDKDPE